jgi:two-component system, NtrC family, sensor histidine kinase HydH
MTAYQIVSLAACVGGLALALLCLARATASPLALPVALLCLDIFGWIGAGLAHDVSGVPGWRWIDHALTPWTSPLALQFILVFVGRRREFRRTLRVVSVVSAGLSAASLAAFFVPAVQPFIGSPAWSILLLVILSAPTMVFAGLLLSRHLRESTDADELARTRLLLAAVGIGTILAITEEVKGYGAPPLGAVGMLVTFTIVSVVALRFRLFDRDISLRAVGYVLALASVSTIAALIVFRLFEAVVAIPVIVGAAILLASATAGRRWLSEGTERRARREQLATLGRFSAQMAHDLKNPLAALKGAAQLLREDASRPAPSVDRVRFTDLMLEQIERLDGVVDLYGRLARVEPQRESLDVNAAVRGVLALQSLVREAVVVRAELAEPLPPCDADADMLARVVENLVRNAMEAMPQGGTIVVSTTADPSGVVLSVKDDGSGMDARTRERAFDDFFTTKPQGSGLGLAFVRRIVDAHGGDVTLSSEPGRGTLVRVRLPSG